MQPHPLRAHSPRLADGARQHQPTESAPDESLDQAEVGDLHAAVVVALQLEVPGGLAVDLQLPQTDIGLREMFRELRIGPLQPVVPVPLFADVPVQPSKERNGTGIVSNDPGARGGGGCRAELGRVVEREIRSNDLDAAQASVP